MLGKTVSYRSVQSPVYLKCKKYKTIIFYLQLYVFLLKKMHTWEYLKPNWGYWVSAGEGEE